MRISVRPPASVSVTTSFTSVPIRRDDEEPSASTRSRGRSSALQHAGADRIVDVVVDVGDQVGDAHDLAFDRARAKRRRHAHRRARLPLRVLGDAVADFPGEIQAAAVVLEHVDDAQALFVVIESAGHQAVDDPLAGMAERRMTEVVTEGDRFGQLFVQPQHLGDGARDLRHLEGVREPGPVMIAGRREEDLRLVLQPAERLAVNDAIAIALKRRPHLVLDFRAAAVRASRRSWPPAARESRAPALRAVPRDGSLTETHLREEARAMRDALPTLKTSASVWPEIGKGLSAFPRSMPRPDACARSRATARIPANDRCSASTDRCRDPP